MCATRLIINAAPIAGAMQPLKHLVQAAGAP